MSQEEAGMAAPGWGSGRADRPARSGQPWEQSDYEALVAGCRAGDTSIAELSRSLGRGESTVLDRLRRMLPVEERGLPRHRALHRLRELLQEDPGYDWDAASATGCWPW